MGRTAKMARALVVERILSFLDKFIDIAMILSLLIWGPIGCFVVGLVMSLAFAASVLELEIRTGFTGIDDLKAWIMETDDSEDTRFEQRIKPLLRWMLSSHRGMLLIGSVFYLESDYVTLILRRKNETRVSTYFRVMLPSVTWGIVVWTLFYWSVHLAATRGIPWLWIEATGCSPAACLTKPEWQPVLEILQTIEGAYHTLLNLFA